MDIEQQEAAAKLGARNSRTDKQRIREIRTKSKEISEISIEIEPEDEDGVITPGAPAKADLPIENKDQPATDALKANILELVFKYVPATVSEGQY